MAPGVYEARSPGPLTNFRISTSTGRVQIGRSGGGLVLHTRRGPWRTGARMLPADPGDPCLFALEREGSYAGNVALLRESDGRVTGLRLDLLAELVRNDAIEPWAS